MTKSVTEVNFSNGAKFLAKLTDEEAAQIVELITVIGAKRDSEVGWLMRPEGDTNVG